MKRNKYNRTYTKKITRNLLIIGVINGTLPYVLSLCNKDPVTDLGIVWVQGVVVVALGYFVRGFKDTKSIAESNYIDESILNGSGRVDGENDK